MSKAWNFTVINCPCCQLSAGKYVSQLLSELAVPILCECKTKKINLSHACEMGTTESYFTVKSGKIDLRRNVSVTGNCPHSDRISHLPLRFFCLRMLVSLFRDHLFLLYRSNKSFLDPAPFPGAATNN